MGGIFTSNETVPPAAAAPAAPLSTAEAEYAFQSFRIVPASTDDGEVLALTPPLVRLYNTDMRPDHAVLPDAGGDAPDHVPHLLQAIGRLFAAYLNPNLWSVWTHDPNNARRLHGVTVQFLDRPEDFCVVCGNATAAVVAVVRTPPAFVVVQSTKYVSQAHETVRITLYFTNTFAKHTVWFNNVATLKYVMYRIVHDFLALESARADGSRLMYAQMCDAVRHSVRTRTMRIGLQ